MKFCRRNSTNSADNLNDESIRCGFAERLPDFFMATLVGPGGSRFQNCVHTRSFRLTQTIGERFRNMPKVTIAKSRDGPGRRERNRAGHGHVFWCPWQSDLQPTKVAVGLVPGGGSTQRLPRLIGRGRALEVLLVAMISQRAGRTLRLYQSSFACEGTDALCEKLAQRIASFPGIPLLTPKRLSISEHMLHAEGFWWKLMSPI